MISGLQIVKKTPLVITTDDGGDIKVWDIRSLKCLQTLSIGYVI